MRCEWVEGTHNCGWRLRCGGGWRGPRPPPGWPPAPTPPSSHLPHATGLHYTDVECVVGRSEALIWVVTITRHFRNDSCHNDTVAMWRGMDVSLAYLLPDTGTVAKWHFKYSTLLQYCWLQCECGGSGNNVKLPPGAESLALHNWSNSNVHTYRQVDMTARFGPNIKVTT